MKKLVGSAMILLLLSVVSPALACGGKGSSTKAAKADQACVSSQSRISGATPISSETKASANPKVTTLESSNGRKVESKHADFKTAAGLPGCCSSGSIDKPDMTSAGKSVGEASYCPATVSPTAASLRDVASSGDIETQIKTNSLNSGMALMTERPEP